MRRRRGLLHYIEIAALAVLCIPVSAVITFLLTAGFDIPTPGLYAAMKLVPDPKGGGWNPGAFDTLIPRLAVAGAINAICCCVIILAVAAVVVHFSRRKGPPAPSGRP